MSRYHDDIVHHARNIRKDIVILSLKNISDLSITVNTLHNQSIIDETRTKRAYLLNLTDCFEQRNDVEHFICILHIL